MPAAGQLDVWDLKLPSFGIRITKRGTRTFILKQNNRRYTIGRYPIITLKVGVPTMVTPCSDAWRPPIQIDGDQGGVRAPLGEVGHLSVVM